jgi:hypothetical protein
MLSKLVTDSAQNVKLDHATADKSPFVARTVVFIIDLDCLPKVCIASTALTVASVRLAGMKLFKRKLRITQDKLSRGASLVSPVWRGECGATSEY